ncbi:hypothetical protein CKY47_25610 [Saccharothrix yanglingensis]|uniref:HTH cro/C1-type domain-containing protein n=2 Tax=Saccharothrix yanglingensis TaxID=659496 RepID=A0ABU0X5C1_9PSEU|nr:hypothetical protein [Saccharothrix yanglingensis]
MTEPAGVRLAREIRRRRTEAGLSQPQLARKIGYTRQYVSLAERAGHNLPSAEVVRALDHALGTGGALMALREEGRNEQKRLRQQYGRAANEQQKNLLDDVADVRDAGSRARIEFHSDDTAVTMSTGDAAPSA